MLSSPSSRPSEFLYLSCPHHLLVHVTSIDSIPEFLGHLLSHPTALLRLVQTQTPQPYLSFRLRSSASSILQHHFDNHKGPSSTVVVTLTQIRSPPKLCAKLMVISCNCSINSMLSVSQRMLSRAYRGPSSFFSLRTHRHKRRSTKKRAWQFIQLRSP